MSPNEMTVEALLRAHAPHAPEPLRARVLALEPVRRPTKRLVLVALPAALVVAAVGAAVVHGVVGSGSNKVDATEQRTFGEAVPATPPAVRSSLHSETGDTAAAQQKALAPSVGAAARLQRTDASIDLRVGDEDALSKATTRATQIATSLGGYAQSVDYHSRGSATVQLRVPSENVKKAIARLAGLGTIVSQNLSVTDLQQRLTTQSEQIAQLRRRVAALQKALKDAALPESQRVLLQIRLAESKRALAQRLNARKGTIAAGTTARVSVSIVTKKAAVTPPPHRGRIGRMLHGAVGFLALEAIVALYALIVISPFALVAGLVWLWRRRSLDRLLAA
jgi:hypothetical protein